MTELEIAKTVCTPKEYAAFELHVRHYSERRIALALDISRSAVQSRLENAKRKIHAAHRKDAA